MDKRVIFAVAGSGKTTHIVDLLNNFNRTLIITYTENNFSNLKSKISKKYNDSIPDNIILMTYFKFLYNFCYKPILSDEIRALGIDFKAKPYKYANSSSRHYYLTNLNYFYSNRLALFLEKYFDEIKRRLLKYFDLIIIDEVQDISGRDFNFLSKIMKIETNFLFVGDFYQHTYETSLDGNTNTNLFEDKEKYEQRFIDSKFTIDNTSLVKSWRCSKKVCAFISNFLGINIFSNDTSNIGDVFIVDNSDEILKLWNDKSIIKLHYKKGDLYGIDHMNWGESKGIDKYNDVCVLLNKNTYEKMEKNELIKLPSRTKNKLYVAITRAHRNVYLVSEQTALSLLH